MFERPEAGYDSAITTFSPEGRIFQVEYAIEAVKRGTPVVGVKGKDCVVLAVAKKVPDKLTETEKFKKIFIVDDHIAAAVSGLHSDARVILNYARLQAQMERLLYGEPVLIDALIKKISQLKQTYTQQGGVRPFGVALLVGGIDVNGIQLYSTDPSGTYYSWKATALGKAEESLEFLKEHYKPNLDLASALKICIDALKASEPDLSVENVEVAYLTVEDPKVKFASPKELKKLI
ncbi:MAG: archaeal proteasome endopeptidase complex subunit alpha [Candidatus Odinarchaeia archaeon]